MHTIHYVNSDDEDLPIENCDDDRGLGRTTTRPGSIRRQHKSPGPVRIPHSSNCAIGMAKAMQLAGGDTYIQAAINADWGLTLPPLKVYSEAD